MRLWKREHFSHVWDVSALSIWNQLGVAWITLQSWMPKTWSSAKKISKRILSSVVSEHMKIATVVLLLHAFCIDILIKLELQAKWRDLFQCDSELPAISTRDAVQNPLNILEAAWAQLLSQPDANHIATYTRHDCCVKFCCESETNSNKQASNT